VLELLWMWDYVCYPIRVPHLPIVLRRFRLPLFLDSRYMKVVKFSALRTVAFIPKGIAKALIRVRGCVDPCVTVNEYSH